VDGVAEVIRWVQSAEWALLALAAINLWRVHRTPAATWLTVTFGALALVVIAGLVLPDDQTELTIFVRVLLAALFLFPYFLFRFVTSMVDRRRWAWISAHVLTAAALAFALLIPSLPQPGEPRTPGFVLFLVVFIAQWGFLLTHVAWRLWRAGKGQPAVARRRMRTMAVGASVLALVIVASAGASSGASGTTTRPIDLVVSALGLLAAPLFFVGFDPPRFVRLLWRQREEADLRATEIGLVRAISRPDVANAWLPRVSELVGGRGAVVFDMDRSILATHNFTDPEVERAAAVLTTDATRYEAVEAGPYRVLSMHNGWLVVAIGALTPFFGDDELRMLGASSVVADLALGRARLFELERQSREAMSDFVAIASHDLRTPVTVIAGFTDLMNEQWDVVDDDQKQEYLKAISRQVGHLHRLIDDLLTVSKLDVRAIDVFRKPVDVEQVVRDVLDELGDDVAIVIDPSLGYARAWADADHVSRMVRNYVTNARTYGSRPVSIGISVENAHVVVRVRDAGQGIPDDFVPRLFGKFARLDKKKSKSVHGTGLGLSIVRGLAEMNDGTAWYEPNEPTGACFCFRLPVAANASSEATHA
jgi:signal transduction histidine kinase